MTAPAYPDALREQVEAYLEQLRFPAPTAPRTAGLEEAMRYSLLAGGKRIRPVLALATARATQRDAATVFAARGGDRADPHVLADSRRPPGDGRRRPAPRAAHLPREVRRGRRDPRRRRAVRGGVQAPPDRPGGGAGADHDGGGRARRGHGRGRHGRRAIPRRGRVRDHPPTSCAPCMRSRPGA
jgi:hypothetical protein